MNLFPSCTPKAENNSLLHFPPIKPPSVPPIAPPIGPPIANPIPRPIREVPQVTEVVPAFLFSPLSAAGIPSIWPAMIIPAAGS